VCAALTAPIARHSRQRFFTNHSSISIRPSTTISPHVRCTLEDGALDIRHAVLRPKFYLARSVTTLAGLQKYEVREEDNWYDHDIARLLSKEPGKQLERYRSL